MVFVFFEGDKKGLLSCIHIFTSLRGLLVHGLQKVANGFHGRTVSDFEINVILERSAGISLVEIHTVGEQAGVGQHDVVAVYEIAHVGLSRADFEHNTEHVFGRDGNHIAASEALAANQKNAAEKVAHPIILGDKHQQCEEAEYARGLQGIFESPNIDEHHH